MTELKTKLVWNEVRKGEEWHAGGLARFYKIVHRPAAGDLARRDKDTHRSDFFSLYLSYPEGMDHYITSAGALKFIKERAQEHADKAR